MKRTLHNRLSVRSLGNGFFLLMLFLLCVVVLLWRPFFTGIFWRVSQPLLQTGKLILTPVDFVLGGFSSKAALSAQNAALQAQLASTSAALADRNSLYQETLDLKARMGRDATLHTILAGVLLAPPRVPYDTLLVDAGSNQGVAVGDLVSAGGTLVVGSISEVHSASAIVTLYSAPALRWPVLLVPRGVASTSVASKSVPLELEGQGGGSMRGQVPAGTHVLVGDSVVTPGVAGGFAGTVSAVTKKDSESFETVYVTLPINPQELPFVEVWKK